MNLRRKTSDLSLEKTLKILTPDLRMKILDLHSWSNCCVIDDGFDTVVEFRFDRMGRGRTTLVGDISTRKQVSGRETMRFFFGYFKDWGVERRIFLIRRNMAIMFTFPESFRSIICVKDFISPQARRVTILPCRGNVIPAGPDVYDNGKFRKDEAEVDVAKNLQLIPKNTVFQSYDSCFRHCDLDFSGLSLEKLRITCCSENKTNKPLKTLKIGNVQNFSFSLPPSSDYEPQNHEESFRNISEELDLDFTYTRFPFQDMSRFRAKRIYINSAQFHPGPDFLFPAKTEELRICITTDFPLTENAIRAISGDRLSHLKHCTLMYEKCDRDFSWIMDFIKDHGSTLKSFSFTITEDMCTSDISILDDDFTNNSIESLVIFANTSVPDRFMEILMRGLVGVKDLKIMPLFKRDYEFLRSPRSSICKLEYLPEGFLTKRYRYKKDVFMREEEFERSEEELERIRQLRLKQNPKWGGKVVKKKKETRFTFGFCGISDIFDEEGRKTNEDRDVQNKPLFEFLDRLTSLVLLGAKSSYGYPNHLTRNLLPLCKNLQRLVLYVSRWGAEPISIMSRVSKTCKRISFLDRSSNLDQGLIYSLWVNELKRQKEEIMAKKGMKVDTEKKSKGMKKQIYRRRRSNEDEYTKFFENGRFDRLTFPNLLFSEKIKSEDPYDDEDDEYGFGGRRQKKRLCYDYKSKMKVLDSLSHFNILLSKEIVCTHPQTMKPVTRICFQEDCIDDEDDEVKEEEEEQSQHNEKKEKREKMISDVIYLPEQLTKKWRTQIFEMESKIKSDRNMSYQLKDRLKSLKKRVGEAGSERMNQEESEKFRKMSIERWSLEDRENEDYGSLDWKNYFESRSKLDTCKEFENCEDIDDDDSMIKLSTYRRIIAKVLLAHFKFLKNNKPLIKRIVRSCYIIGTGPSFGMSTYYGNEIHCRVYSLLANCDYVNFELKFHLRSRSYGCEFYCTSIIDDQDLFVEKAYYDDLRREGLDIGDLKNVQEWWKRITGTNVLRHDIDLVSGAILKFFYAVAGYRMKLQYSECDEFNLNYKWMFYMFSMKYGLEMPVYNMIGIEEEDFKMINQDLGIFDRPKERKVGGGRGGLFQNFTDMIQNQLFGGVNQDDREDNEDQGTESVFQDPLMMLAANLFQNQRPPNQGDEEGGCTIQ